MIAFKGDISKNCKEFLKKQDLHERWIMWLVIIFLLSAGIVFLAAIWDWIALSFLFLPFMIVIGDYFSMPQNANRSYPKSITITKDEIWLECQAGIITRSLLDVKCVVDYGDWYYIQFYFPHHKYFACQKDLIIEGTIEEFEEQFKDSIAYKNAEK